VGTFIARISKCRTIRQFILGVLIVPTIVTCLWISAFGSVSILEVMNGNTAIADAVQNDVSTALFVFLETIPFTEAISVLAMCYSLHKGLNQDLKKKKEAEKANAVTHAIPNSSTSKMNSETTDKVK
jgi:choline-glycine betaine transporter